MTRDSYWSYFHLLGRGSQRGKVWSWELKLEGSASPFEASFALDKDPWKVFEILTTTNPVAYEQPPYGSLKTTYIDYSSPGAPSRTLRLYLNYACPD